MRQSAVTCLYRRYRFISLLILVDSGQVEVDEHNGLEKLCSICTGVEGTTFSSDTGKSACGELGMLVMLEA